MVTTRSQHYQNTSYTHMNTDSTRTRGLQQHTDNNPTMKTRSQTRAMQQQQARRNDEMIAAMGLLALHTMCITQRITNNDRQK